jgi:hypothetical protein
MPLLQGVEAVLHVLHDCYGYEYPGGLFLAAVDVMLEKPAAVQPVQQLLQAIAGVTDSIAQACRCAAFAVAQDWLKFGVPGQA